MSWAEVSCRVCSEDRAREAIGGRAVRKAYHGEEWPACVFEPKQRRRVVAPSPMRRKLSKWVAYQNEWPQPARAAVDFFVFECRGPLHASLRTYFANARSNACGRERELRCNRFMKPSAARLESGLGSKRRNS